MHHVDTWNIDVYRGCSHLKNVIAYPNQLLLQELQVPRTHPFEIEEIAVSINSIRFTLKLLQIIKARKNNASGMHLFT